MTASRHAGAGKAASGQSGEQPPCFVMPCQTRPCPAAGSRPLTTRNWRPNLAAVAKFTDALERDTAKLRKSRLKLDEVVRLLKTGTDPVSIQHDIESAVVQLRAEGAKANGALDDMKELKTVAKEALGLNAEPQTT
jgi:hypothetical protein